MLFSIGQRELFEAGIIRRRGLAVGRTRSAGYFTFFRRSEVIFMLYGLLALVSLILTIASFYIYYGNAQTLYIVLAIIFLIATVGFGGVFLSGRINKTDDIHITE